MKFIFLILFVFCTSMIPSLSSAQNMNVQMEKALGLSATEWRQMYFTGISKKPVSKINFNEAQISSILSVINIQAAISTGVAIEPKYLINKKGTTPWLAMFALLKVNDPRNLNLIANGKSSIHVPEKYIQSAFYGHINWPSKILRKYDNTLSKYHTFVIPFLVHKNVTEIHNLSRTMKSPDNNLEIFGVHEFNERKPEDLLKEFDKLARLIREKRIETIMK